MLRNKQNNKINTFVSPLVMNIIQSNLKRSFWKNEERISCC